MFQGYHKQNIESNNVSLLSLKIKLYVLAIDHLNFYTSISDLKSIREGLSILQFEWIGISYNNNYS